MNLRLNRLTLALASVTSVTLLTLSACGGGGGGVAPDTSTTAVTTTVIDGALQNALVCVDANSSGECDAGELQGKTDAAGNVTLAVPNGDVGKYPLVALVGTDAIDIDNGPVTEAYTLSTPAGKTGVVTPLTSMVHQAMGTGLTVEEAEKAVKVASGITVSLFQDFTTAAAKAEAAAAGGSNPADVARMIVVTTQKQSVDLKSAEGAEAIDGTKISRKDINKALRKKLLEMLPSVANALNDPATAALTGKAKEDAVVGALGGSLMTAAALKTEVAVINQAALPAVAYMPGASFSMSYLNYTDASNWIVRTTSSSLAQSTPDSSGLLRYVARRSRADNGVIANWNSHSNPRQQSDIHWSGTAWAAYPLNCEGTATIADAAGNQSYSDCSNIYMGKNSRASFDISGKTMSVVYADVKAAGYSDINVANVAALGTAKFPDGSKLRYQTGADTSLAVAYGVGSDNLVEKNNNGSGTSQACALNYSDMPATKLEDLVSTFVGKPCSYQSPDTITSSAGTFTNPAGNIVSWGPTVLHLGDIGNGALSSTPTSFFTGKTRVVAAFTGGAGSNEVTYYSCQQRQIEGYTRNCVVTGTKGTYAIATLGDARVMTFTKPPAIRDSLDYDQVFVERAGKVYYGYQSKLKTYKGARLNGTAANALFAQLGMPQVDPEVPLALTATSYQGTWDTTDPAGPAGNGSVLVFSAGGTSTCSDRPTGTPFSCTFTVTNPATGAFTGMNNSNGSVLAGTLNFLTGSGNGTYTVPSPGTFVATRR